MSQQPVYGFPCVINPHDFDPDRDCCSPAEIEAWQRAKANWGKPTFKPNEGSFTERDKSGQMVRHVLRTSWGLGVNLINACDGCGVSVGDVLAGDERLMTCHECGGMDFCTVCWPKHEKEHDL